MTDLRDIELDDQVIDEDITCCNQPMHTDGTVYECFTCRSNARIGLGRIVDDLVLKTSQPQSETNRD